MLTVSDHVKTLQALKFFKTKAKAAKFMHLTSPALNYRMTSIQTMYGIDVKVPGKWELSQDGEKLLKKLLDMMEHLHQTEVEKVTKPKHPITMKALQMLAHDAGVSLERVVDAFSDMIVDYEVTFEEAEKSLTVLDGTLVKAWVDPNMFLDRWGDDKEDFDADALEIFMCGSADLQQALHVADPIHLPQLDDLLDAVFNELA